MRADSDSASVLSFSAMIKAENVGGNISRTLRLEIGSGLVSFRSRNEEVVL